MMSLWLFSLLLPFLFIIGQLNAAAKPTFKIDYKRNEFLKDSQVFRFVSGAMHYFRVPPESWRDRLSKMRYGGLNVVET